MKLTKLISEIKNPKVANYDLMVSLLPKFQKIFHDAQIKIEHYPIGSRAEIHFTIKRKCYATERFGPKWKIEIVGSDIFYMENVTDHDHPEFWPDYSTIFPQSDDLKIFISKIINFLKADYIKEDADLFNEIKQINPIRVNVYDEDENFVWFAFDDMDEYYLQYKDWLNSYYISFNVNFGRGFAQWRKLKRYLDSKQIPYEENKYTDTISIKIPKQYIIKNNDTRSNNTR